MPAGVEMHCGVEDCLYFLAQAAESALQGVGFPRRGPKVSLRGNGEIPHLLPFKFRIGPPIERLTRQLSQRGTKTTKRTITVILPTFYAAC